MLLLLCATSGALAFWAIDRIHDWLPMPALYGASGSLVAGTLLVWKRLVASIASRSMPQ